MTVPTEGIQAKTGLKLYQIIMILQDWRRSRPGGAVKCPPFVGADGACDFRGEERSTARRSWSDGGPSVQAHLLFRCETERRVAVGRDVGEFRADGAVVNDCANESHRSLVVWRGQRTDGKI